MTTLMKRNSNGNGNMPATTFSGLVDTFFNSKIDRLLDDNFWGFRGLDRSTSVPVNIKDTGKSYELHLVAPGLQKQDFKVNLNGDTLTVSYEHKEQQQDQNNEEGWLRNEYRLQSFSRSFTLDESLDPGKISARYADGVLQLSIPKKEGAQKISRNIEIS